MLQILHISDPHFERQSMERLHDLAETNRDCDIVAATGDYVSNHNSVLPANWDNWPQQLKLSVPGGHSDQTDAFNKLRNWTHQVPWVVYFGDVAFIGVNSEKTGGAREFLQATVLTSESRAIVLLCHEWISGYYVTVGLEEPLAALAESRQLLVLHGHEHPREFDGVEWDETGRVAGKPFYRSRVCSSARVRRGMGNRILWDCERFSSTPVQGCR